MKTPAALKAPRGFIFKGNVGQPSKSGAAVRLFQPDFAGAVFQSAFPARLVRHGCPPRLSVHGCSTAAAMPAPVKSFFYLSRPFEREFCGDNGDYFIYNRRGGNRA